MATLWIRNPNSQTSGATPQNENGVAELDTLASGRGQGGCERGAQWLGFFNNGDGAGGGSDAFVGKPGHLIALPAGASKTYPLTRAGAQYGEIDWDDDGNQLLITVIY